MLLLTGSTLPKQRLTAAAGICCTLTVNEASQNSTGKDGISKYKLTIPLRKREASTPLKQVYSSIKTSQDSAELTRTRLNPNRAQAETIPCVTPSLLLTARVLLSCKHRSSQSCSLASIPPLGPPVWGQEGSAPTINTRWSW